MVYRVFTIILLITVSGCADTQYAIDNICRKAGFDPASSECSVYYFSNHIHNPTDYEDQQILMVAPGGDANDRFNGDGADFRIENEEFHEQIDVLEN
jgi:hypothetical protein